MVLLNKMLLSLCLVPGTLWSEVIASRDSKLAFPFFCCCWWFFFFKFYLGTFHTISQNFYFPTVLVNAIYVSERLPTLLLGKASLEWQRTCDIWGSWYNEESRSRDFSLVSSGGKHSVINTSTHTDSWRLPVIFSRLFFFNPRERLAFLGGWGFSYYSFGFVFKICCLLSCAFLVSKLCSF